MLSNFFNQNMYDATALQRKRRERVTSLSVIILLFAFVFGSNLGYGQEFFQRNSNDEGFMLQKYTTMTTVNSGETFDYRIAFIVPPNDTDANITDINIVDQLPPELEFVSIWPTSIINNECSQSTPITFTETLPTVGERGGTYRLTIANAPCGAAGSILIKVKFPEGITCNGTQAENTVCMNYKFNGKENELCLRKGITTTATAVNTWKVEKIVMPYTYANQGGACPHAINDSIIKYRISVKHDGNRYGQLNLVNGVVTDQLPPGASLVQGNSTCMSQNGSVLEWNVGNLPVYIPSSNTPYSVYCEFSVLYPRAIFPVGSFIKNKATLTGTAGDTAKPNCAKVFDTDSVCSELKEFRNGEIEKIVYTNNQVGCAGYYIIKVSNKGNVPLYDVFMEDHIPDGITFNNISTNGPMGWAATYDGSSRLVTLVAGSLVLDPNMRVTIRVDFTINDDTPAGTVIRNCAKIQAKGIVTKEICSEFTVIAPAPKACLQNMICNPKNCYSPGDTLTLRLSVRNIGGDNILSPKIIDMLNSNLIYIGNVKGYISNNLNEACGHESDNWGRNIVSLFDNTTNTLTLEIDDIPFNCNAFGTCNTISGDLVPYYFIEFQVKVSDSSDIGKLYNDFSFMGTNLSSVTSSRVSYDVCANTNYFINKEVKATGTDVYGETATITNGGSVDYRLSLQIPIETPPLAHIRHVSFIEELPMNVNSTTDKNLMNCGNRGSTFGLSTIGAFTSSNNPSPTPYGCSITNSGYPEIATWATPGTTTNIFVNGCSTMNTSSWNPLSTPTSLTPNTKNIGFYFNQWAFVPHNSIYPWVEFTVKADSASVNDTIACNNFVASGAVRILINGVIRDVPVIERQSGKVCITMNNVSCNGDEIGEPIIDTACCSTFIPISNLNESDITEIRYNISGGQIENFDILGSCGSFTTNPTPVYGSSSGTITFNPACTASSFNLGVGVLATQTPSTIHLEIVHANGTICKDSLVFACKPAPQLKCDSIKIVDSGWSGHSSTVRSGKVITIENEIFPPSDICSIEISTSTIPHASAGPSQWDGGSFFVNGISKNWIVAGPNDLTGEDVPPYINYSKIRFLPGFQGTQPAGGINKVEFTISLPRAWNWSGDLIIKVIHCDGRVCERQVNWCAKSNRRDCIRVVDGLEDPRRRIFATNTIFGGSFDIFGSEKIEIRYASIEIDNPEKAELLAISSENLLERRATDSLYSGPEYLSSRMTSAGGFVEFRGLHNSKDILPFNYLIHKLDSNRKDTVIDLTVILYDQDGEPVSISSVKTDTPLSLIESDLETEGFARPYILKPFPNPTSVEVNLKYWLPANEKATMEIYNNIGHKVLTVDDVSSNKGFNNININTSSLISGTYLVKLASKSGVATTTFIVAR